MTEESRVGFIKDCETRVGRVGLQQVSKTRSTTTKKTTSSKEEKEVGGRGTTTILQVPLSYTHPRIHSGFACAPLTQPTGVETRDGGPGPSMRR